ncbi:shikimate kinase [Paenibacillus sambharensis]|uniref:Shikimate kinase n=1 Tax=Paenibacillus sambharensis TaxID=1803190 RepID=A0A2W1LS08_9BACL|nr:AAA family ATPase [Paenibacillus sambharensis]PZD97274.1 shikimate kinase [Paenibacillus sambharensis]
MKFILIFGPQAVGKMTVGHELTKITDLKLFHNHMSIELFHPFFGFGRETWRLANLLRREFFESYASSNQYGLIFTYVWGFDLQEDWEFVNQTCEIFESKDAEVYFVELESSLEERLKRNVTPYRLEQKPTKRNTEQSEQDLRATMDKHRLSSYEGEITRSNYVRINNTDMSPEEVARMVKERFLL